MIKYNTFLVVFQINKGHMERILKINKRRFEKYDNISYYVSYESNSDNSR